MALRPGTQIIQRETPPPRSAPTDTGVWFVAGLSDKGQTVPIKIESMSDFERIFGLRQSYSVLYDALDLFFHEGGRTAYVSRVIGPAAVTASKNLLDGSAGISLVVTALGAGAWGNGLSVAVLAPLVAGYRIQISQGATILETSPDLATQQAAVDWAAATSQYISIAIGASSLNPATAAAAALAGGNDDRNNITDTQWLNALNLFTADLGPGQVSYPGRTTDPAHVQLLSHAATNERIALLDLPDTSSDATLRASAAAGRATGNGRFGAAFAPWVRVPGLPTVPGTIRTVPPSAYVAGNIARIDASLGPNNPAAGINGQALWATGLSQMAWTDTIRDQLNTGSVNVIRMLYGGVRTYGWRTLVDPVTDPTWINLANSRLYMAIAARAGVIAESYVLRMIDGAGRTISTFGGELTAMLAPFFADGSLFGATPDEAYFVDVGNQVNTPTTIANNELRAVISMRMSPMGELVTIEIVKVGTTEAL